LFLAAGEIFAFVALNELIYTEAPPNMKAMVKALEQLTACVGAAIGMTLGPVSRDPQVLIMYAALAGAMAMTGAIFYRMFSRYATG
jgi:proton-dependent oligopeptide transporter, POT family